MSGGNSSKNKAKSKRQEGWEEAGGEFYQELYPGANTDQDLFENLQRADAAKLATLLPSKQIRNTTVKRVRSQNERRQSTYARTTQSHDVHLSMLPDLSENLSNEERTWDEIMQIKAMPLPMAQKRDLKARLQNATKLRLQGLEQLHWRQRKVWHRFRIKFGEMLGKLELWQKPMKKIEGNFGTGVVSYFLFLRWLLFLNLAISTLIIMFLIIPKVFLVEPDLCHLEPNSTDCCAKAYFSKNLTESNFFLDILQGTGLTERTILFYNVYSNSIYKYYFKDIFDTELYYNMPLAYILVPIAWALFSLAAIVKSAAKGFKDRLIESEGQFYMYCNLVFGGWDFCIRSENCAKIKHKALFNEVRGCLEEERFKEEKQLRSRESQILLYLKRILINLIVIAILLASGVLIYLIFNFSIQRLEDKNQKSEENSKLSSSDSSFLDTSVAINHKSEENSKLSSSDSSFLDTIEGNFTAKAEGFHLRQLADEIYLGGFENLLLEFLPSLCIVGLNVVVPEVFDYLIRYENYRPAVVIKLTLLRTVFLRLSSLAVLISQIYLRITPERRCSTDSDGILECWENYVGQQLYKLILTDFSIHFIMTFFINFPRALLARHVNNKCFRMIGQQEFYLPKHVLDIVYTQTIIWMGAFFCPFLPIIGTMFYFLMFYIKNFACLVNSTPSPTIYRASKSKSLFMFVLLISFIISIVPVAYSVAEIVPSINCGPYRGLNTVWEFVLKTFGTFPNFVREAIFLLGTSTFAIPAFAVLLLFLYYYWAVATANRHMVAVLKNQLVLEGHDKQFLLNRLSAFIRQHQRRCERARNRASFADDNSSNRQSSK